jgi:SAM-dependent methyltransferase
MPMTWRTSQAASRARYLAKFDEAEGRGWAQGPAPEVQDAYLADLAGLLAPGQAVLDAGAGAGAFTQVLTRFGGLDLTALEPAPAMAAHIRDARVVLGFCDAPEDRPLFPAGSFDVIASRQLTNGLYDPLAAFRNWHHWLKPGGRVVVIDGFYGRDAWQGKWAEEVDDLPLSATQSLALTPYLLEQAGLRVETVRPMAATNASSATATPRYLVVATRDN